LVREAGPKPDDQIRRVWQLAFNRVPSQEETRDALAFVAEQGLPAMARALFNANEFLFIP